MKIKNYDFVLISNVLILSYLLFDYFNFIGLTCLVLCITYLILRLLKINKVFILYVISLILGIIYYFLNPIYEEINVTFASILPIVFVILSLLHAITSPLLKRNSFSGVKTPLALNNDEVWFLVNSSASKFYYSIIFPLFVIVLYFQNDVKIVLSVILYLGCAVSILINAYCIEKKYTEKLKLQRKIELQNIETKETGG